MPFKIQPRSPLNIRDDDIEHYWRVAVGFTTGRGAVEAPGITPTAQAEAGRFWAEALEELDNERSAEEQTARLIVDGKNPHGARK